ncbi:hypothetical protein LY76DRAFT_602328 [Colletotrichum caudatum]|nr:hypothetical protein LY76DRAFT_602328 [Colletotrichum caudatum]
MPSSTNISFTTNTSRVVSFVSVIKLGRAAVILENCSNFGLQCQVIGRLWRLGQREKVFWKILQTQDTFNPTVEAEAALDDRIQGSWRTVCAFEIFLMEEVRKEGYLFSAVAQWLIAHPEDAGSVANMSAIAKRWNSTMVMTKETILSRSVWLLLDRTESVSMPAI